MSEVEHTSDHRSDINKSQERESQKSEADQPPQENPTQPEQPSHDDLEPANIIISTPQRNSGQNSPSQKSVQIEEPGSE